MESKIRSNDASLIRMAENFHEASPPLCTVQLILEFHSEIVGEN